MRGIEAEGMSWVFSNHHQSRIEFAHSNFPACCRGISKYNFLQRQPFLKFLRVGYRPAPLFSHCFCPKGQKSYIGSHSFHLEKKNIIKLIYLLLLDPPLSFVTATPHYSFNANQRRKMQRTEVQHAHCGAYLCLQIAIFCKENPCFGFKFFYQIKSNGEKSWVVVELILSLPSRFSVSPAQVMTRLPASPIGSISTTWGFNQST